MAVSDKTRKILWGLSGSRCAICRVRLVIDKTDSDDESVVGDECHLISAALKGPRNQSASSLEKLDHISNLILLYRVHHKMIDDQTEKYTVTKLAEIKANHENWVNSRLQQIEEVDRVTLKRFINEIPFLLPSIKSGRDLFNLASNCFGHYKHYSDPSTDNEVEVIGGFFQDISDWMDLNDVLEPIDQVRAAKSIEDQIKHLREMGFFVFAAVERQRLQGGVSKPADFPILHISIIRENDPSIISMEPEKSI